jgi:hypothetical protein
MALDNKKKPLRKGIGKIRTALSNAMSGSVAAADKNETDPDLKLGIEAKKNPLISTKSAAPLPTIADEERSLNTDEQKNDASNIIVANSLPNAGNEILDGAIKDENTSFQELTNAAKIAKEADVEEQKIKTQTAQQNIDVSNALSETAKNLYTSSDGAVAGYETTATKEQVEKDLAEQTKKDIYSSIDLPTGLALDQLGVQDYFPTIGDNIITGSFSGRRLGSVTMFGAGGTVIPFGLMDARKRALVDAAQKKQAAMQKLQELPNAPEQLNAAFKQYAHQRISELSEKHNYDPSAFMKDKEAMSELYRLQTTAESMVNVDKQFDELIKNRVGADGKPEYYIPEELLKQMYDYQMGKVDNMEDYFSGKKNVSELLKNAKNFADGTRMADARIAELLKYPRELPMNLKKGTQIDQAALDEINAARKKVAGGTGYDAYLSVIKKYYDIDVDGVVDPWMNDAGYAQDDPARQWVKDYFEAQIPKETIEQKIDYQANKDFDYYKFNKEFDYKKTQEMAYWETVAAKFKDANTEKELMAVQARINAETDPNKKASMLADAYNNIPGFASLGFKVQQDKNNPNRVYGYVAVPGGERRKSTTVENDRAKIYCDGKGWVTFSELKQNVKRTKNGDGTYSLKYNEGYTPVTRGTGSSQVEFDNDMGTIIDASAGNNIDVSAYEHQIEAGYTSGGKRYPLTTKNGQYYSNAKDKTMFVTTKVNPMIQGPVVDDKPTFRASKVSFQMQSDIEDFGQLQTLEVLSGVKGETEDKFEGNE